MGLIRQYELTINCSIFFLFCIGFCKFFLIFPQKSHPLFLGFGKGPLHFTPTQDRPSPSSKVRLNLTPYCFFEKEEKNTLGKYLLPPASAELF